MLITRLAKIVMCLALAAFCLLVAYDNITDLHCELHVRAARDEHGHDLSRTTSLMYRAITNPLAVADHLCADHRRARGVCGILFLAGAIGMWRVRSCRAPMFNRAKAYAIAGCLLAFLLWFFVFMVIAGEWFAMWQSKDWNAQYASFRFYMTVLGRPHLLSISPTANPRCQRDRALVTG